MAEITYVTIPELTAAANSQVTDSALLEMAVVDGSAASGYASKKVTKEQLLSDLKSDLGDLSDLETTDKSSIVAAINEAAQSGGGGGGSVTVDSAMSSTSTNPVQNRVIYSALQDKANSADLATVATSGSYNDLTGKPTIPSISGLQTQAITDAGGYFSTDTVEAALQQLGAAVDGVATLLAAI